LLIRSLTTGGAERQLVELAKGLDRETFDVTVVSFYAGGEFARELAATNVPVISLDKTGRWDILPFLIRFVTLLRKLRPDVLKTDMAGANLVASLMKPLFPHTRVVWGIEASYIYYNRYDWLPRLTARLQILLSRLPDVIVFNSFAGRDYHVSAGFKGARMVVIQNGIDTTQFAPDLKAGFRLRASWRMPEGSLLIGIVGRLDPIKDHPTFLRAAAILAGSRPDVTFVCIGGGPEEYARDLRNLADDLGLQGRVIWPGFVTKDMAAAYNALDLCSSSSYGEGTSNAIAEAMACGVPCVVTDVGDSALIVGDTGVVVPPKNPDALAVGWAAMIERLAGNPGLRAAARKRIESNLSAETLVANMSNTLLGLL
jgi:glycosyltransferase involved in cell wall biosynthesis